MNLLIKKAKIVDPNGPFHNRTLDILIEQGKIVKIAPNIKADSTATYSAKNLHVSLGWLDLHANFRDPGLEHQEDLSSGCKAAAQGGFTGVLLMPNTHPPTDNKAQVEYIFGKTKNNIVSVYIAGCISQEMNGKDITEMYDMRNAGAIAFTDDKHSITNNELLKNALLYAKDFNGLILHFPNDPNLSKGGQIHEGKTSTILGLKGIPEVAEEVAIDRDISLCNYTESRLHLSYLSTKNSVSKLKEAKQKGLKITADVALHNLLLTDQEIAHFDTRYKVMPPLRTAADCNALIKGLKTGVIDAICTDHSPEDEENKKTEFDKAAFGIIGLETAFGLIGSRLSKHLSLDEIIEKIAINPRRILEMSDTCLNIGMEANLTLFDPDLEWVFLKSDIVSKSVNTPFVGAKLKGKALAIYNKGIFSGNAEL